MPTAVGTSVKLESTAYVKRFNHHTEPAVVHDSSGKTNEAIMAIAYTTTTTEAAKAIHFICCRSSPPERR
jgi:hypothetical protein